MKRITIDYDPEQPGTEDGPLDLFWDLSTILNEAGYAANIEEVEIQDGDTTMTFSASEADTVLAALRYWNREGIMSGGHEQDIAEEHGDALTADEIDDLCERLNT